MNQLILSPAQARLIILHAAGLVRPAQFGKGKEAVMKVIKHLGYVQLDTNYTVERAHHHALAARVPDYQLTWLDELQHDGRIYEFLTSDSGFMPMEDYRFSIPVQQAFASRYADLPGADANGMQRVLDRIEREGPLMLGDFGYDRTEASSGWWDWRPAKIFLERLYLQGSVMVTRDKKFHKQYDLPINVIPKGTNITAPSPEEYARHIIRLTLRSLGIAYAKEIAWRTRFVKNNLIKTEVEKMADEGEILRVTVDGLKGKQLYMLPAYRNKKIRTPDAAYVLSPFDPLNVFRHRLKDFFDFDYQIECFVPAPKRKYGYFSLPILLGDRFVARMDSKADRKNEVLIVHNLHFEPGTISKEELTRVAEGIRSFADFNKCRTITFAKSNKSTYVKEIQKQLRSLPIK